MKYALATIVCLALLGAASNSDSAAPRELERYCFNKAQHVRPALRTDEQEHFIANCIADHTPTPGSKPRKKRTYYFELVERGKGSERLL